MKPIIFLNTAWMERYEGLPNPNTEIYGGGAYIKEYGYGGEIFNFKTNGNMVYGYVQPKGYNKLERLGAHKNDDYIEDIIAVFTAAHKSGGTYIVGWYKNATFYRDYQYEEMEERKFKNEYRGYYVTADVKNTTLLSVDERFSFPKIPRRVKGGMGQSNVWYADSSGMLEFREQVLKQIEEYDKGKHKRKNKSLKRNIDMDKKKQVEEIAVEKVTKEYCNRGFTVTSCEAENKGWDLEAEFNQIKLKIEVKGLSGTKISVDITPNEYAMMKKFMESYRLCVVTECREEPFLNIFSYSIEKNKWIDEEGNELRIEEIISGRCYV